MSIVSGDPDTRNGESKTRNCPTGKNSMSSIRNYPKRAVCTIFSLACYLSAHENMTIFCIEAFITTLTCVESDAFQHMNRQVMSDNGCRQISQIEVLLDKLSDTDFKFYVRANVVSSK